MKITPTFNSGIKLEFEKGYLVIHEVKGKLQIRAPRSDELLLSSDNKQYLEIKVEQYERSRTLFLSVPNQIRVE